MQDDELSKRYSEERRILLRNCQAAVRQHEDMENMKHDVIEVSSLPAANHKCATTTNNSNHFIINSTTTACHREKKMSGRRRASRMNTTTTITTTRSLLTNSILFLSAVWLAAAAAATVTAEQTATTTTTTTTTTTKQPPEPVALARTNDNNGNNVILIKYANVSSASSEQESTTTSDDVQAHELKVYQLVNEPLTVSVIESKFAHSIKLFDVSQNQLSTLSKDLFCPLSDKVRRLNVSHNLVDNFDCIGLISQAGQLCLSEVRVLDMSYNLIKHLPATGVATLHNLEILNLSHNLIESLDELSLSSLFKLIKLDLSHNRLQQLPMKIFHKSSSMQVLKLQSNHLQSNINQQLLAGLLSLEELNLSHNNISHVSDQAFVDKINLTLVDLRYNQLASLRQEALRVTLLKSSSSFQAPGSGSSSSSSSSGVVYRHRLHHNGQLAGVVAPATKQQQQQQHSLSASAEILLSSNPFTCDCQLEWMRKFQPNQAIKQSVLSSPAATGSQTPYGDQYQSDQAAPVISGISSSSSSGGALESSSTNNNISEIIPSHHHQTTSSSILHQPNQIVAHHTNHHQQQQQQQPSSQKQQQQHHHYARIGDLNLVKCNPLLRRNAHRTASNNGHYHRASSASRALAPPDGKHLQQHDTTMIDLLSADAGQFLCRYKSHCFALCQCCEFDACDCEMICPNGCNCYYDSTWQTNIIDCSANNHTVVPDRIPMDVSSLSLDGNNIPSLKPSNLIARKSLRTLYLNSSNLQTIANRSFNGLIELQVLYLHDNLLRSLQGYEFEPLSQLKALYLQSNRLDYINNQSFIYLRSLEILDLSNNRLTTHSLELFMSIGHDNIRLRQLSIAHNWWSCQCNAVNRFRQILRQKFPQSGGVNIVDKNQLRCYYNSTTVGPLILGSADGVSSSSIGAPLYAYNRQQQHYQQQSQQQQTQLTEINQCTEVIDKSQEIDINPPIIQASPTDPADGILNTPPEDYTNDPYRTNPQLQHQQSPNPNNPFNTQLDQSYPMDPFAGIPPATNSRFNDNNNYNNVGLNGPGGSGSMSLPSLLLLSILFICSMVIAVSVFLFVRQQQHQSHHKKSSAASTTSASSSASSTAISSLNGKRHHHLQQHPHHHQTMQHHQLIMSGNNGTATTTSIVNHHLQPAHLHHAQPMHHHQHSASSQSNIYAALVSPTNGQSTTVTHQHHNLYSNSSTTASHHSTNSSHGVYPNSNQQQQQQQQHWQQSASIYNQPYGGAAMENHYTLNAASGQPGYKTGSLYNAVAASNCHELAPDAYHHSQQQQIAANDWIKLPKVKQFMSKLVNKSLALGGYKSCSRDELSAISTSDKIYDAFISYDKHDESFVMQHLSAELEYGQPQYRIADRFRDLPLPSSAYIEEAITSVIGCSHRTIIVLSKNYLQSDWCRYELQAALKETSLDRSHKIIAVVLDPKCLLEMDNEMRALLTHNNVSLQQQQQPIYCSSGASNQYGQLVQLDSSPSDQQQHLVATLLNQSGGNQQVSTQATAQPANQQSASASASSSSTSPRITFINYNERKFWPKLKQLMPQARPSSSHALTLTTKN